MPAILPQHVDAARMAQARQMYEGSLPVASMRRLATSLASAEGDVAYQMAFDRGADGRTLVRVHAEGQFALVCQRSLEVFTLPIVVDQDFGVIATERDEAALLPDVEPLLSPDGMINPTELIEDELILALPLIPVKPGAEMPPVGANNVESTENSESRPNPFEVLRDLKRNPDDA